MSKKIKKPSLYHLLNLTINESFPLKSADGNVTTFLSRENKILHIFG